MTYDIEKIIQDLRHPVDIAPDNAILYLKGALDIDDEYEKLGNHKCPLLDGLIEDDVEKMEIFLEASFDYCVQEATIVTAEYCMKKDVTDGIDRIEILIRAAMFFWNRIVDRVNNLYIPVCNMEGSRKIGDVEYLVMVKDSILFILYGGMAPHQRRISTTVLKTILSEIEPESVKNLESADITNANSNPNLPPEITDSIFQESGLSDLMKLFREIGTYRPARDYNDPEKEKLHDQIDELIDRVFCAFPDEK